MPTPNFTAPHMERRSSQSLQPAQAARPGPPGRRRSSYWCGNPPAAALALSWFSRLMLAYELGVLWQGGTSAAALAHRGRCLDAAAAGLGGTDRPVAACR